ncbi:MAG: peroxiredoxin [Saprospiraceae bacterium]|jgi:peroxiredoxin
MKSLINTFLLALLIGVTVTAQNGYKVGDTAADFSLKGVDGNMHSLADMKDAKGYIVTFTCNHCPYAIMYEDRLISIQNEFEPKGYQVVAINPNDPEVKPEDSFDNMVIRAEEKKFNFPYLIDDGQKVYPVYGATKTPHVFLLDNKLEVKYIGAIDDNARSADDVEERYLANAINALESGTNPNPSTTKAIGCGIKSK